VSLGSPASDLKTIIAGEPFVLGLDQYKDKAPSRLQKAMAMRLGNKSQEFVVLLDSNACMPMPPACLRRFHGLVIIATFPRRSRWHWALKQAVSSLSTGPHGQASYQCSRKHFFHVRPPSPTEALACLNV
jgi:hypothetical protein